eukprot:1173005-Prymnesium_polylepis.1
MSPSRPARARRAAHRRLPSTVQLTHAHAMSMSMCMRLRSVCHSRLSLCFRPASRSDPFRDTVHVL